MNCLAEIQTVLSNEMKKIQSCSPTDEDYLSFLNEMNETVNNFVLSNLKVFHDESSSTRMNLSEITKQLSNLTDVITSNFEKSKEEKQKLKNSMEFEEEIEEKINLEKSKHMNEFYKNNSTVTDVLESIKHIEEVIGEILRETAESESYVAVCEKNMLEKQKKLDELKRIKEQEEREIKEAEQREIERAKEAAKEEERKRIEMERMKKELEKVKNEKNEEKYHLTRIMLEHGEFGVNSLGCYIRTKADCLISADNLKISLIDPLDVNWSLNATEEVVSNIIRLSSISDEENVFKFDQAFSVILPHNLGRVGSKEPKIFQFNHSDNIWILQETKEVSVDDVDKTGARFVEAVFGELPLTLTVVSVPRMEQVVYGKKGCNWSAAADSRVTLLIPPNSVKITLEMQVKTQTFDSTFTQDLKAKTKGTAVDNILTFTHILQIQSKKRRLLKPVILNMPLPERIGDKMNSSSIPSLNLGMEGRSKMAFGGNIDDSEEVVKIFTLDSNREWTEYLKYDVEHEKKDSIRFELNEFKDQTFIGVCTKADTTSEQTVRGINMIMDHLKLRQIKVLLNRRVDNHNSLAVTICPVTRLERQLRLLKEDGYEDTHHTSPELEVREREVLALRFRGNVKVCNGTSGVSTNENKECVYVFRYCSQLKNRIQFDLEVVDKYAQRSKPQYQGFVALTMSKWSKKPKPKAEGETRKGPPPMIDVEEIITLFESVVEIPKVNGSVPVGDNKNKEFHFTSNDSVTEEFILQLCPKIENEWRSLATALNLPQQRIEEVLEMSKETKSNTKLAYEVLKLWVMHLPISRNKEKMIKKALVKINREDIIETFMAA